MGVKLQLVKKYGKEFASCAYKNENGCVNKLVSQKILYQNDPSIEIVDVSEQYARSKAHRTLFEYTGTSVATDGPSQSRMPERAYNEQVSSSSESIASKVS